MKILIALIMTVCLLLCMASLPEAACNECHSKNPKMRKMHEALGYKDCFKCHGMGQVKKGDEQKTQMKSDALCISCHK